MKNGEIPPKNYVEIYTFYICQNPWVIDQHTHQKKKKYSLKELGVVREIMTGSYTAWYIHCLSSSLGKEKWRVKIIWSSKPPSCILSTRLPKFNVLWGFIKYVLYNIITHEWHFLQDGCQAGQGLGHTAYMEKLKVEWFSLEKKGLRGNFIALCLKGDHRKDRSKLSLERHNRRMQSNGQKSQERQFYKGKKPSPSKKSWTLEQVVQKGGLCS